MTPLSGLKFIPTVTTIASALTRYSYAPVPTKTFPPTCSVKSNFREPWPAPSQLVGSLAPFDWQRSHNADCSDAATARRLPKLCQIRLVAPDSRRPILCTVASARSIVSRSGSVAGEKSFTAAIATKSIEDSARSSC